MTAETKSNRPITKEERAALRVRWATPVLPAEREALRLLDVLDEVECERDEAVETLRAAQSVGCARSDHKHFDVQFARTIKAEAACAVMREALDAVRRQALYCIENSGEERDDAVRDLDLALAHPGFATNAGRALLEEVKALRAACHLAAEDIADSIEQCGDNCDEWNHSRDVLDQCRAALVLANTKGGG